MWSTLGWWAWGSPGPGAPPSGWDADFIAVRCGEGGRFHGLGGQSDDVVAVHRLGAGGCGSVAGDHSPDAGGDVEVELASRALTVMGVAPSSGPTE